MNVIPLNYKGEAVRFNTDGWVNVTGIAERYGKRIDNWMRPAETLEYVRALDDALTGEESQILHPSQSRYVKPVGRERTGVAGRGYIPSFPLRLPVGVMLALLCGATCTLIACFVAN